MLCSLLTAVLFSSEAIPPPDSALIFSKPHMTERAHVESFKSLIQTTGYSHEPILLLGNHIQGLATLLESHGIPVYSMVAEAFLFNAHFEDEKLIAYKFGAILMPEETPLSRVLAKEIERRIERGGLLFVGYITTGFEQSLVHRGFERLPMTFRQFAISGPQESLGHMFHIYRKTNGHVPNNHTGRIEEAA